MREQRLLRSKAMRALLWYAADGKCQICGGELGDDWQADHITPWSKTHKTNVHDMQALCAKCNREKGNMGWRRHQADMDGLAKRITSGASSCRTILADVTPAGGKSLLPVILAARLIPAKADRICWVVPRRNLQRQAERSFMEPFARKLLDHTQLIRISTNDYDPCRGHQGYVTTYQAIAWAPKLHADEFDRHRYILVLDEPHHVEEGSEWHNKLQPLIDKAAFVLLMSGTFERGDRKPIAFLPYREGEKQRQFPDFQPNETTAVIRYNRSHAIGEQAIKPLEFRHLDGQLEWIDGDGVKQRIDSFEQSTNDSEALFTALNTNYAKQLLTECVQDWQAYKKKNPRAKLLVIAPRIKVAREVYQRVLEGLGVKSIVATSDDSDSALLAIERFKGDKKPEIDALVTVMMAYEGMDVPAITHVACLTHIRSKPWLEQALTRAARVDSKAGAYEQQYGRIWIPNDSIAANEVIAQIEAEQKGTWLSTAWRWTWL